MITKVKTATHIGIDAQSVLVEVDASRGLPSEHIVGLPDAVIRESKSRIRAAIKNSGFTYEVKSYIINLAPAQLPKEGPAFDLPIAAGILDATQQINLPADAFFVGELLLDGGIKAVKGILSICELAREMKCSKLFIPKENLEEVDLLKDLTIIPLTHLSELHQINELTPIKTKGMIPTFSYQKDQGLSHIIGQGLAKRALKIALSGKHNLLLIGPPGCGKTMLANAIPSLLPNLSYDEIIETSKIHSISTSSSEKLVIQRPFRKPHHSLSTISMVGGGNRPQPGEISLAHHGVLFLDELSEFSKHTIESLRQPLEDKTITISRVNYSTTFPTDFQLICTMNPCPCGYYKDGTEKCTCSKLIIERYWKKISGPILDRIDLIVSVQKIKKEEFLSSTPNLDEDDDVRNEIVHCKSHQHQRGQTTLNGSLNAKEIREWCPITPDIQEFLGIAIEKGELTGRSSAKVIKVARTIADLDEQHRIQLSHILEAMQYRTVLVN